MSIPTSDYHAGTDFRAVLTRSATGSAMGKYFDRLKAGDYVFSIQASAFHYAHPRQDLDDPRLYSEFEVALFKDGCWVRSNEKGFEEFSELWEDTGDTAVMPYVPAETVQKMLDRAVIL